MSNIKPWVRYSLKDGSILEISMQSDPAPSDTEGILFIDEETAQEFFSGISNPNMFFVQVDRNCLLSKADSRYARTAWYLDDITNGSESVEIITRYEDGLLLQRKDKSSTSMVIYVTREQDPHVLLSRHLLEPGGSDQRLYFDTSISHSIYARQNVT